MSRSNLRELNIYIDGASKGNPGPAGCGVVIEDSSSKLIKNISKSIGNATNNIAEYKALIFGMEEARNLGAKELVINTDSELVAKQLGGEYKIKNYNLKELYSRALKILEDFDEVRINRIDRKDNRGADKLANKAVASAVKKSSSSSFILKSKR